MSQDSSQEFDFGLSVDEFDYNPLADASDYDDEEGVDERDGGQVPAGDVPTPPADTRPASERIEELFKEMDARRQTLLGLLRFLQEPKNADLLQGEVDRLQEHDYSIYTAADYSSLMEAAGAIMKVSANGVPFADDDEVSPLVVQIDGVEYLKPAPYKQTYWVDTEDGQAYLDADKPLERFYELLEKEKRYAVIYKRVLTACAQEGGQPISAITPMVDEDPLVQKPRMNAPHFVKCLEKCEALYWDGAWHVSDIGRLGLERLADVVDDYVSPGPAGDAEGEE